MGNLLSALHTWVIARAHSGSILLRIDDLDVDRCKDEFIEGIIEQLQALGIDWDFGPSSLSEHKSNYSQPNHFTYYLNELQRKLGPEEKVFACECSRKQLGKFEGNAYSGTCRDKGIPLTDSDVSWRMLIEENSKIIVSDFLLGEREYDLREICGDYIVRRRDQIPAYHLVSLLEDTRNQIDLVIRGEDLLESTATQLDLAKRLNLEQFGKARFLQHSLLSDEKGQKLSKSRGSFALLAKDLAEDSTRKRVFTEYLKWAGLKMRAQSKNQPKAQPETANEILELFLEI